MSKRLKDILEVKAAAYADDLALYATAKSTEEHKVRVNGALIKVELWMKKNGLTLVPEKTEAVFRSGRKKIRPEDLHVGSSTNTLQRRGGLFRGD